ncbi:MAG: ATP-dependent helicase [Propionibacteriaceae bacterium]|jgi:DNA helicase-2/ATP-dependent DNA helicase PcrA|nr:ATP-dependent helicase [Propionibacteriaceae bacterium]
MLNEPSDLAEVLGIPFSAEQLQAIAAPLSPGVIIAGAGSGKTTVMAARVVWLVGSGQLERGQVLGLTFTRKATAELSARIFSALAKAGISDEDEELVLTYDSFAARLVREYGMLLGVEPELRLLNDAARFQLACEVVSAAPGPFAHFGDSSVPALARRVLSLAQAMNSHLLGDADLRGFAAAFQQELEQAPLYRGKPYADIAAALQTTLARTELLQLVDAYQQAKASRGYADFSDQLALAAEIVKRHQAVPDTLRSQYRIVLLDEYQDTSAAQATLLGRLFSGETPATGLGHPVSAVGDPSQAIYGWRGAASSNILGFAAQFRKADGSQADSYPLRVNRRSQGQIIGPANELAAGLPERAGRPELALTLPKSIGRGRVETALFDTWALELASIADKIAALVETGVVSGWKSVAVLARTNWQVSDLYTVLAARDIPAEIVGLGGLLRVPAVAQILATLQVLHDPMANPALVELLGGPRWAIGKSDLAALGKRARQLDHGEPSLLEAVYDPPPDISPECGRRLALFSAELDELGSWASGSLIDLVDQVAARLGVRGELRVNGSGSAMLTAFRDAVGEYASFGADADLGGLLAYLEAELTEGMGLEQPVLSQEDCVKLLTVHRAKGLEWDAVFLPALADQVFPYRHGEPLYTSNPTVLPAPLRGDAGAIPQLHAVTKAGLADYAEQMKLAHRQSEDRLAYVAVTRAKTMVYASSHVWIAGLKTARTPSPYFQVLRAFADVHSEPEQFSAENPHQLAETELAWPDLGDIEHRRRRSLAAESVREALARQGAGQPLPPELLAWARRADALIAEAFPEPLVEAPRYLSVSALSRLRKDRHAFLQDLLLPTPKLVRESQRAGSRFHRWLEQRMAGQLTLDDEQFGDLPAADTELIAAFSASRYADLTPVAVEAPFTLTLAGKVIRGRIDAVFAAVGSHAYQVVDWKTGDARRSDPLQLACYRLAWSRLRGVGLDQVDAVFYDLSRGEEVRPAQIWTDAQLEELVANVAGDE